MCTWLQWSKHREVQRIKKKTHNIKTIKKQTGEINTIQRTGRREMY